MIIFVCSLLTKEKGGYKNGRTKGRKKQLRISLGTAILLFIIILLSVAIVAMTVYFKSEKPNTIESKVNNTEITDTKKAFKYALKGNSLEDFDLRFCN